MSEHSGNGEASPSNFRNQIYNANLPIHVYSSIGKSIKTQILDFISYLVNINTPYIYTYIKDLMC